MLKRVIAVFVAVLPLQAQTSPKPTLSISPFAIADGKPPADPGRSACPVTPAEIRNVTPEEQSGALAALTAELKQKLEKKGVVTPDENASHPAPGAIVLLGCLTRIDGGNASKRLIGAGMGSSLLKAHVQLVRMDAGKPSVLEEFDEEFKGRNFGVGTGMLINAMRTMRTSAAGDAANLAGKIADKIADKIAPALEAQSKVIGK